MKIYATLFAMFAGAVAGQASDSENSLASVCDNMTEGDTCYITLPDDSTVAGKCTTPESVSACGPEFTEGDKCMMCVQSNSDDAEASGDNTDAAGKENVATAACDGAAENDECNYKTLDGEAVSGVCTDEGPGACGPDSSGTCYVCSADVVVGGDNTGGVQNGNECTGLSIGDTCDLPNGNGEGVCTETAEDLETGDGNLSCAPEGQEGSVGSSPSAAPEDDAASLVSDVLQSACTNKKADDECTYYNADSELQSGFCVSVGEVLQCDDESNKANAVDSETEQDLSNACTGLSAGSSCTIVTDILSLSGVCQTDDNGDMICSPQFSLRGR